MEANEKTHKKNGKKKWIWIAGVVIVIVAIIIFSNKRKVHFIFDTEVVEEDSITAMVTATGVIKPVYQVTVGTKGSGIVEKLYVDYNDVVKKGQLLAELDKSEVLEAKKTAEAQMRAAQSNLNVAQRNYDRVKTLFEQKAATQEEFDQAGSSLENAKSSMVNARSGYENTLTQLRYAEIYSPIDGIIIKKNVAEGQTVQGAYSVPDLFTIAKDMKEIQVEASVDEADIGKVACGQEVNFSVDAYPETTFCGTVEQIRRDAITTNNVVTYVVVIRAANDDEKLFPGMTASVRIITERGKGLRIPYYATKFNIDEKMELVLKTEGYHLERLNDTTAATKVWVKSGRKLRQTAIETGAKDNVHTIATGVSIGDTIVSDIIDPFEQHNIRSPFNQE